jgi:hypothetical protein
MTTPKQERPKIADVLANMKRMGWPVRNGRARHKIITTPTGATLTINADSDSTAGRAYANDLAQIRRAGYFEAWERHSSGLQLTRAATRAEPAKRSPWATETGMYTVTHTVTPELAARFLDLPRATLRDGTLIQQRALSMAWVSEIAGWIRDGDWMESFEGLAFTGEGVNDPGAMLEGMHRCWAIIEAGTPVPARLTFRAPAELFQVTNQGKKRGAQGVLQTLGETGARDMASTLRMIWSYEGHHSGDDRFGPLWRNWTSVPLSGSTTVAVRKHHTDPLCGPSLYDSMFMVGVMRKLKGVSSAGIAWHHLASRAWEGEPSVLELFVEKLRTGANLDPGDPALAAREWLRTMAGKRQTEKRERTFIGLTKAWIACANRDEMNRLSVSDDAPVPLMPARPRTRRSRPAAD